MWIKLLNTNVDIQTSKISDKIRVPISKIGMDQMSRANTKKEILGFTGLKYVCRVVCSEGINKGDK